VEQLLKDFVIPLQNVWNFLKTYADVDGWVDDGTKVYFVENSHTLSQEQETRIHASHTVDAGPSLSEVID